MDYLSAVAGGSRAAAWLAAWMKREGNDPGNVEHSSTPSRIAEARARRQYLAPGEVVDEEPQPLATPAFPRHARLMRAFLHRFVAANTGEPADSWVGSGASFDAGDCRREACRRAVRDFNSLSQIADAAGAVDSRLGTPTLVAGVIALGCWSWSGCRLWVAFSSIAGALREFRADPSGAASSPRVTSAPAAQSPDRLIVAGGVVVVELLCAANRKWIIELIEKAWSGPKHGSLFSFRTVVEDVLPDLTILSWPNFLLHVVVFGGLMAWWASRTRPSRSAPTAKVHRRIAGRGGNRWSAPGID